MFRKIGFLLGGIMSIVLMGLIIGLISYLVCRFTPAPVSVVVAVAVLVYVIYLKNEIPVIKIRMHGFPRYNPYEFGTAEYYKYEQGMDIKEQLNQLSK